MAVSAQQQMIIKIELRHNKFHDVHARSRCRDLEERALSAERALEVAKAQANELDTACQAATKEIGEVKQRARALLEEKDAQLQAARVSFHAFNQFCLLLAD